MEEERVGVSKVYFPFLEGRQEGLNCGFLIELLRNNRQMFYQYQGI
jgi:hypothetical protein